MKQQINLYTEEFRYQEPPFSGEIILSIWLKLVLILLMIIVIISGFWIWQNWSLKRVTVAVHEHEHELNKIKTQYPPREIEDKLQNYLEINRNLLINRKKLLTYLKDYNQTLVVLKNATYADVLTKIAEIEETNAWLQRIEIQEKKLALSGLTIDYAVMSKYIKALSASLNKEFKYFRLKPDKEKAKLWSFRLNTAVEEFEDSDP